MLQVNAVAFSENDMLVSVDGAVPDGSDDVVDARCLVGRDK